MIPISRRKLKMDAAGLAFGVLSAFNVVVEDIRLVRDAQKLGHDYQTTQLKFQLAEARIVRWGVSVGVAGQESSLTDLPASALEKLMPEADRAKARMALQAIITELETANRKMSDLSQKHTQDEAEKGRQPSLSRILGRSKGTETQNTGTEQAMDDRATALAEDFKQISLKRHRGTSASKKAKYVLFEKEVLRELLSSIRDLTDELEALFPVTHPELHSLASEEANAVQTEALRELLQQNAERGEVRDNLLLDALKGESGGSIQGSGSSFNFSGGSVNNNHGIQTTKDATFNNSTINLGGRGQ